MKKEVNDNCITLALYFLFQGGWQRWATCHAGRHIMDADTGRQLVIHWAGDLSTSFLSQCSASPPPRLARGVGDRERRTQQRQRLSNEWHVDPSRFPEEFGEDADNGMIEIVKT